MTINLKPNPLLALLFALPFLSACQPNQTTSTPVSDAEPSQQVTHQEHVKPDEPMVNEGHADSTNQVNVSKRPAFTMADSRLDLNFTNDDVSISDEQRQAVVSFITQMDNNPAIRYDVTGYYGDDISQETANQRANTVATSMLDGGVSEAGLGMQNIRIHTMEKTSDDQADVSMTCC